jgi:hypothetical protein
VLDVTPVVKVQLKVLQPLPVTVWPVKQEECVEPSSALPISKVLMLEPEARRADKVKVYCVPLNNVEVLRLNFAPLVAVAGVVTANELLPMYFCVEL